METTDNSAVAAAFRITSLEPTSVVQEHVEQIVTRYGLGFQVRYEETFNAPFCGIDYHTQEMAILVQEPNANGLDIAGCMEDVAALPADSLADGFFEVIG